MRVYFYYLARQYLKGLVITPQTNIIGEEITGRVYYAIKKILDNLLEEVICITEGKQNQATVGIYQNLLQCRSACDVIISYFCYFTCSLQLITNIISLQMNMDMIKKKRKVDDAFYSDYNTITSMI